MAEEKVKVTLRKNHGARVTRWGFCRPGGSIEMPREAADQLDPYVWDVPGKGTPEKKTKTKSGGKAAEGKE